MLPLLAVLISIQANFEGGRLGQTERIGTDHYRCHILGQTDQEGRNRQASWYYFRVDHAAGHKLTFDLVDLAGEYNYQPNRGAITKDTLPFYSSDNVNWHPIEEAKYDPSAPMLQFSVDARSDQLWIAHVPPYTTRNLDALFRELTNVPQAKVETVGKSVEGRSIPLVTVTDPSVPDTRKRVIWLMFRQHAWEAGSSWTGEGVMRFLSSSSPSAVRIRKDAIVNYYGYDLNRNWDITDPVRMPEIMAERKAILDWVDQGKRIDFFLTLHNTETNEYLNGPPDSTGKLRPLLDRVYKLWSVGSTFSAAQPPTFTNSTTTAGRPGRMNVVQGLYRDRQVPAFEVEMRIAKHPKLGRRPTIDDRKRAGEELIQAIWKALNTSS
jgi:hypothetical protein